LNATPSEPLRIGILLSGKGRGSNMQALIDATRDGRIPGTVALVVSTSPGAPALERAAQSGVPTRLLAASEYDSADALDHAIATAFEEAGVQLVCLAGYMRLLTNGFVQHFAGRLMNVHPGLLPAFGGQGFYGRRVHEAVLTSGARFTGVTVHFVDEEYDHGPIILQRVVPVLDDDTPEALAARVLVEEHAAYPDAVRLFAEGRLRVEGRRVRVLSPAPESSGVR
jgi:formyltetrahydrofolate-dependent phosphoribosylglycinamide formyltransferase